MLVTFVGCPCSGKTTTAALSFASLKETGLPTEFIPEYARQFIARKRLSQGLKPQDRLILDDEDQFRIMTEQADLEQTMSSVCGPEVVVISDSWSLSALLYMSEEMRASDRVKDLISKVVTLPDLVFYASPVSLPFILDPNRVHDEKQSQVIDALIPEILARFAPDRQVISLHGSAIFRSASVSSEIFDKLRNVG